MEKRKLVLAISFLFFVSGFAIAQNRAYSKPIHIESINTKGKISGYSDPLVVSVVNGKISKKSPVISIGVSKNPNLKIESTSVEAVSSANPVVENKTIKEQPEEKKQNMPVQETVITTPQVPVDNVTVSRATEQPSKTSAAPSLGAEYGSSIPKYTALIIGVSEYKFSGQGLPSLDNPVKDAQNLYKVLTNNYTFDSASSRILKNPTRQEIIDVLEQLSSEMGPKDNLLVFYAGHGYYDKVKEFGYWLPSDSKANTRGEWIPNSTIKDYLAAIPSKHTLLITDACFGGSIFKSRAVDAATFLKVHDLYKDPSKKAITSGNLTEVPDKSLFLEQLLKKLSENEDEYLPSQKLFSRIYEPITNNSTATPQFGVIQGAGDEGGDFIFIKRQK